MSKFAIISSLFWVDFLHLLRWFRTGTLGKVIVAFLFILLFGFLSLFIFVGSYNFLYSLAGYEVFGKMSALYLVHASIIVTLWLGIASSFISTYIFLVSRDPDLDLLLTYPVSSFLIVLRIFIRSLLSSLVWSLIILFPLGLAVYRIFSIGSPAESFLSLFLLVGLIVITCSVIGSLLAFFVTFFHRFVRPSVYVPLLSAAFIFATLLLLRYLLPSDLSRLYAASAEDFPIIFNRLPLNRIFLPTLPMAQLLFGIQSESLFSLISALTLLFGITIIYQGHELTRLRQSLAGEQGIPFLSKKVNPLFFKNNFSLITKDVASVFRSHSDLGYGLFLIFLVFGFFFFLGGSIRSVTNPDRLSDISHYALAWLLFYSIAYLMRLVFPLMAKEGRTAWLLFTLPIRPGLILNQKIFASIILSLPIYLLSYLLWPLLGVGQNLALFAFSALMFFTVFTTLFGSLFPNFPEGDSPERVSTSIIGLTTLVTLLGLSYLLISKLALLSSSVSIFLVVILFSLLVLILLKVVAVTAVSRYLF